MDYEDEARKVLMSFNPKPICVASAWDEAVSAIAAALRAAAEQAELKQMERDCAAQCSECKKGVPRANLFHWHQNGDRTDCGAWHIRTAWGTRTAPVTTVRHEP